MSQEVREFKPIDEFEEKLTSASNGEVPFDKFLPDFLAARVSMPSGDHPGDDGMNFIPLLFDRNGLQMIACYSHPERLKHFADIAPYGLEMTGRAVLERLPAEYGLVLNPGYNVGMELFPNTIASIVKEMKDGMY